MIMDISSATNEQWRRARKTRLSEPQVVKTTFGQYKWQETNNI
jgi:hypothetical protein